MNKGIDKRALILLLFSSIVFLSLNQTPATMDSACFIKSAATLEPCHHSTGYPTYIFSAYLLKGVLGPVFSLRLLSYVFSILAVITTYFIGKRLFSKNVGMIAAFILMFLPMFWFHAITIEVYNIAAFFVAASVLLFLTGFEKKRTSYIYLGFIFFGLSLHFHLISILLAPAICYIALKNRKYVLKEKKCIFIGVIIFSLLTAALFLESNLFGVHSNAAATIIDGIMNLNASTLGNKLVTVIIPLSFTLFLLPVSILYLKDTRIKLLWIWVLSFLVSFFFDMLDVYVLLLPAYTAVALLSAFAIEQLSKRFRISMRFLAFVVILSLFITSIALTPIGYFLSGKKNPYELFAVWADSNLPENSLLFHGADIDHLNLFINKLVLDSNINTTVDNISEFVNNQGAFITSNSIMISEHENVYENFEIEPYRTYELPYDPPYPWMSKRITVYKLGINKNNTDERLEQCRKNVHCGIILDENKEPISGFLVQSNFINPYTAWENVYTDVDGIWYT